MSCKAREGALDAREGPTKDLSDFSKVLGEKGTSFPLGGVR